MSANRLFAVARSDSDRPTPQALFNEWNKEFGFTLDAAATPENAKCARFFTAEDDGLAQPWEGKVWCNPPYGAGEIEHWVRKGWGESQTNADLVVMLLPASTDTKWFHDYCLNGEVRFIKGRIKFEGQKNPAPFGSMLVIFRRLA